MIPFVKPISFAGLESLEGPKYWPERRQHDEKRPILKNNYIFKVYSPILLKFCTKILKNICSGPYFSFSDIRIFPKMAAVLVRNARFGNFGFIQLQFLTC